MKTLILVRHAKSSWTDPSLNDRDRPLNGRGKRDAPWIGSFLRRQDLIPDAIFSSPARRAVKTARKMAAGLDFDKDRIVFRSEIYDGGTEELRRLLDTMDPRLSRVCVVGHNPVLTDFANGLLSGERIDDIPTSGIVAVEFRSEDWSQAVQGRLRLFASPPKGEAER
ncbi:MAG: histidine phosphatase family protein [Methylococcaceae bacterium]|nr:histidine phosphatase family protein [Methylococcaceae bacterium]